MKSCPTCNRTYPDDTIAFCLMDGSVLSAPYEPGEVRRSDPPRNPPVTEVLVAPTVAAKKPPPAQSTMRAEAPPLPTVFKEPRPISASVESRSPSWLLRGGLILRGLIAIAFGVFCLISVNLWVLWLPFSVYAVLVGVIGIVAGLKTFFDYKTGWLLPLEGVVNVGAGLGVFVGMRLTAYSAFITPMCLILSGVFLIGAAMQLRKRVAGTWPMMLSGATSLLFGFILLLIVLFGLMPWLR